MFQESSNATFTTSCLVSPASTIESLTREFENSLDKLPESKVICSADKSSGSSKSSTIRSIHSLDIKQAIKGHYVVKPQDDDVSKAEGPSIDEIERLKNELLLVQNQVSRSNDPVKTTTRSGVGHYSLGPHRYFKIDLVIFLNFNNNF